MLEAGAASSSNDKPHHVTEEGEAGPSLWTCSCKLGVINYKTEQKALNICQDLILNESGETVPTAMAALKRCFAAAPQERGLTFPFQGIGFAVLSSPPQCSIVRSSVLLSTRKILAN